jgi:hypothetical protein
MITFDTACAGINRSDRLTTVRQRLQTALSDSLFDPRRPQKDAGWARRLYWALSNFSHSRPGHTDGDMWKSNGPIYVPRAFVQAVRMHLQVAAFAFILIKIIRPNFALPEGGEECFLPRHPAVPEIARETWKLLQEVS